LSNTVLAVMDDAMLSEQLSDSTMQLIHRYTKK
jgi:hypothetical protein